MPAMYFSVFKEVMNLLRILSLWSRLKKSHFSKDKPVSSTSANFLSCKIVLLSPIHFVFRFNLSHFAKYFSAFFLDE